MRFGSDSSDFQVAWSVAQRDLRYVYVDRTLDALNMNLDILHKLQQSDDLAKINKGEGQETYHKISKQWIQSTRATLTKLPKEAKEGTMCQTGAGIKFTILK